MMAEHRTAHRTAISPGRADGQTRPNVLMLGGFGRSGSTLLERCLAQAPGVVGLGEVLHLWERGLRDDELCGCLEPFSQCPFWTEIGRRAYGNWGTVDVEQAVADRLEVVRNRHLLELITGIAPPRRRIRRDRLLGRLDSLYAAATSPLDTRFLVDSSKHPAYAYLLRHANVNLKCVLVVRDPRGVAYSWSKVVRRPETGAAGENMPQYSTVSAVANWALYGVLFHALSLLRVQVKTVHYEDFMKSPVKVVEDILRFVDIEPDPFDTAHISNEAVELSAHHTVAGNPMRMTTGTVKIRLDSEWRSSMPAKDRRMASLLSFPLRLVYGQRRR